MTEQQSIKNILKPLELIAGRGYHISSVFRDWVSLMLYSLSGQEDLYADVMGRYRNDLPKGEREADLFGSAFSVLHNEMAEYNHDLLGGVYMEIAGNYATKGMGQFFTPIGVCDAMAVMTLADDPGEDAKTVLDPACGSCRTMISAAKRVHPDSRFTGVDADSVCAQMGALNCCFFNMNAVIIHGNTLSMKFYGGWRTSRSVLWGGSVRDMPEKEVEAVRESVINGLNGKEEGEKQEQLTLFEMEEV